MLKSKISLHIVNMQSIHIDQNAINNQKSLPQLSKSAESKKNVSVSKKKTVVARLNCLHAV